MHNMPIDIIATSISGSISDWKKIKQVIPLFREHGYHNVALHVVHSHEDARGITAECLAGGHRILISAGGSGTFNSVLEGCCDSGINLSEITLGFLRKGSADLIGKTLNMPDEIDEAVRVFADTISSNAVVPCDILSAHTEELPVRRHFAGYGGVEIFGEIPLFTENRFTKYYKGLLGQFFGDMGPFYVGASLSSIKKLAYSPFRSRTSWHIEIDGEHIATKPYQALMIVNGYLGRDMPFAPSVPLGSGDFYLLGVQDLGALKFLQQFKQAWGGEIMKNPEKWGFEQYRVQKRLELKPLQDRNFYSNIDGSAFRCKNSLTIEISGKINLLSPGQQLTETATGLSEQIPVQNTPGQSKFTLTQ